MATILEMSFSNFKHRITPNTLERAPEINLEQGLLRRKVIKIDLVGSNSCFGPSWDPKTQLIWVQNIWGHSKAYRQAQFESTPVMVDLTAMRPILSLFYSNSKCNG